MSAHPTSSHGTLADMKYRGLGSSGVEVSEVGFGVWTVATGWWGEHDDASAVGLLRAALERGVTFFDTADTYGEGRGETLLQKAFGSSDEVVIGTKFGYDLYSPWERAGHVERPHDWTPDFVRYALEQSLRRLGRDHIDLYQLHNPRMDALRDDGLFEMLDDLVRAGTVRAVGVALGPAIGWRDEGLFAVEERPIHALQIIHNMLEQQPGRDLIAGAREAGTSIVVRVPHSSGMLEGRYTIDTVFPENDHRRHRPRSWLVEGVQKVERLRFLERDDRELGQAALQWLLHDPAVATCLPNIYGIEQLDEFAAAPETPRLTDEEFRAVEDLWERGYDVAPYVEEAVAGD
jgi:aryl-alcohol dehydrogenase-like predicted oxidoreductase